MTCLFALVLLFYHRGRCPVVGWYLKEGRYLASHTVCTAVYHRCQPLDLLVGTTELQSATMFDTWYPTVYLAILSRYWALSDR